jgi:hypothetical protein
MLVDRKMAVNRRQMAYADEPPPPPPDDGLGKYLAIGILVVVGAAIPVYYLAKRVSATNVRDGGGPAYQAQTKKPKSQTRPTRVTGELPPPAVGSIEVAKLPTPLTEEEIGRALYDGHLKVFNYAPSPERLSMGWAQASFETSRGKECSSNNLGHIVAGEAWDGKFYVFKVAERIRRDPDVWKEINMRFRAYDTPVDGGEDYWRLIKGNFESALAVFDTGNAPAAAEKLCEMGYATANCQQYGTGVSQIYNFVRNNAYPKLAESYIKPNGKPIGSAGK